MKIQHKRWFFTGTEIVACKAYDFDGGVCELRSPSLTELVQLKAHGHHVIDADDGGPSTQPYERPKPKRRKTFELNAKVPADDMEQPQPEIGADVPIDDTPDGAA